MIHTTSKTIFDKSITLIFNSDHLKHNMTNSTTNSTYLTHKEVQAHTLWFYLSKCMWFNHNTELSRHTQENYTTPIMTTSTKHLCVQFSRCFRRCPLAAFITCFHLNSSLSSRLSVLHSCVCSRSIFSVHKSHISFYYNEGKSTWLPMEFC